MWLDDILIIKKNFWFCMVIKWKAEILERFQNVYLCDTRLWLDSRRKYSFSRAIYSVFYDVALLFFLEDRYRESRKLTSCFHDVNFLLVRSLFFYLYDVNFLFPASGFQGINRPDIHILFADSLLFRRFWLKWIVSIKWLFAIF